MLRLPAPRPQSVPGNRQISNCEKLTESPGKSIILCVASESARAGGDVARPPGLHTTSSSSSHAPHPLHFTILLHPHHCKRSKHETAASPCFLLHAPLRIQPHNTSHSAPGKFCRLCLSILLFVLVLLYLMVVGAVHQLRSGTSAPSLILCIVILLSMAVFRIHAAYDVVALPLTSTAVQGNSRRVAHNLPDFDGKCAGMGMASCHITAISPSNTAGHIASHRCGGCAIARKTVLSAPNRHEDLR